jgi:DNA-binding CsgD family transcriptional regulator/tetratricopeptide (TPR) repeat protein
VLASERVGDTVRYRMLETIREYGHERLTGRGEMAALRSRHRDHYLRLAEQAAAQWFGPTQRSWAARLPRESANIRAALHYCLTEPGQTDAGVRMAGALWMYWIPCGFLLDGRAWLDRALAASSTPGRSRARALWATGYVATRQGDIPHALDLLEECRRLARQLGEPTLQAHADSAAGLTLTFADDLTAATEALHRSLAHYRCTGAGPDTQQALALFFLAYVNCLTGDTDGAVALCRECEALCVAHEEHWVRAWALWGLGLAQWLRGDLAHAQIQLRTALRIKYEFGDRSGVLLTAAALAWTAATSGDAERAARLLGATRALWAPLGTYLRGHRAFLRWRDDCERRARRLLGDAAFAASEAEGARFDIDALVADTLDLPRQQGHVRDDTEPPSDLLTERERQVAELVAEGLSSKQIAAQLVIATRTVESHVAHILTKLGFTSRAQIAAWTRCNTGRAAPLGNAT